MPMNDLRVSRPHGRQPSRRLLSKTDNKVYPRCMRRKKPGAACTCKILMPDAMCFEKLRHHRLHLVSWSDPGAEGMKISQARPFEDRFGHSAADRIVGTHKKYVVAFLGHER